MSPKTLYLLHPPTLSLFCFSTSQNTVWTDGEKGSSDAEWRWAETSATAYIAKFTCLGWEETHNFYPTGLLLIKPYEADMVN